MESSRHRNSQRSQKAKSETIIGQTFRLTALVVGFMLVTGMPVHAGPVVINDVIQVINSHQNPSDVQIRGMQTSVVGTTDQKSSGQSTTSAPADTANSLLSGVAINSDPQGLIEIIDLGEFEGTICDCGDMWVPGGFAKWPLLFLVGIPFFFTDDDIPPPGTTPPPGPTPPPSSVPEPASLLVFGTGLAAIGAGLRRRHARAKLAAQIQHAEEGQSI